MKLKNPDLRTSFSIMYNGVIVHVFSLEVICNTSYLEDKFLYFIRGYSYEKKNFSFLLPFNSPEEAFTVADSICSAYPPIIWNDLYAHNFDLYPEFEEERFSR